MCAVASQKDVDSRLTCVSQDTEQNGVVVFPVTFWILKKMSPFGVKKIFGFSQKIPFSGDFLWLKNDKPLVYCKKIPKVWHKICTR